MVKFVDLGVLYFSLVFPRQATLLAAGPECRLLYSLLKSAVGPWANVVLELLIHARTELVLEGSRTGLIPPSPWYLDCTGGPLLGTI